LSITASAELDLSAAEAEVVALDASSVARALPDSAAAARFERLAAAAAQGRIPEQLVRLLETMLELLFEKGRPSNRAILQSVFARTPRGRARHAAAAEVNGAFKSLRGQRVESIRVSAGPAGHTLVLETDAVRLTVELDTRGAHLQSLETG
jgi:hypothetical protein